MHASLILELGFAAPNQVDLDPSRTFRLGRNRSNDIVLHDQHASRWHAEIMHEDRGWILRDLGTLNGTKVNGTRITDSVPLQHGELIGIGEVRLRFCDPEGGTRQDSSTRRRNAGNAPTSAPSLVPAHDDSTFKSDEYTALVDFMSRAVQETTPNGLVNQCLQTIQSQLPSVVCSYHSLDRQENLPRIVLPREASVEPALTQELTTWVQERRSTFWFGSPIPQKRPPLELDGFADVLCVPVRVGDDNSELFGLLHVYQPGQSLVERQVHFCEMLCRCLANNLRVLRIRRNLEADNQRYRGVRMGGRSEEMIGTSVPLARLRDLIRRFADRPFPVLILGESGSGKELVALGLHKLGNRRRGPFIEVNCASVPPDLAESQFFGHVAGAFSGAITDHPGHFQQADEGTLFLDEVADLSMDVQAKLLRAFPDGRNVITFLPLGGQNPVKVSVRIIAATHRDLEELIAMKQFRSDFYNRLAAGSIEVPALRDHAEDIPDLVQHFLDKFNQEYYRQQGRVTIAQSAVDALAAFHWPGNVRQLRAVLERALAMCEPRTEIEVEDLCLPRKTPLGLPTLNVAELEELAIVEAMKQTENNQSKAAAILGMHRDTLRGKWDKITQKQRPQPE